MKEFGVKDNCYYYVVYLRDNEDTKYESEKEEILEAWDKLNHQNALKIIEMCNDGIRPYGGVPYDKESEILAIVISSDEAFSASFLRIAPKLEEESL